MQRHIAKWRRTFPTLEEVPLMHMMLEGPPEDIVDERADLAHLYLGVYILVAGAEASAEITDEHFKVALEIPGATMPLVVSMN